MKKKWIQQICLFAALLMVLTACGTPSKKEPEPTNEIGSTYPLSSFQLVRPDDASDELTAAVMSLNQAVKTYLGKTLPIRTDLNAANETACEILVGDTTRAQSKEVLGSLVDGDYVIKSVETETGMKLIVGGSDEHFTLRAVTALTSLIEQKLIEENGGVKPVSLSYNLYEIYKNYTLQFGEATVIAQGNANINWWGPYQFPKLYYTAKGDLYISWAMWNDSVFGGGNVEGVNEMVSEDGGKTWREATSADTPISSVKMNNGKYFMGFLQGELITVENLSRYTPAISGTGYTKVHFASNIEEYDPVVYALEYDPNSGVTSKFPTEIKWPYMPVTEVAENTLYPLASTMAINNRVGTINIDGVLYHCTYSRGFDSKTGTVSRRSGYYSVYVFRSADNGRTWDYHSQVTFTEEYMTHSNSEGFNECSMEIMRDGSVVMLIRCGDTERPMYMVRSTDNCATWSKPQKFDDRGVYPQIQTLGCGVTVATYGRLGLWVRSTSDPSGLVWQDPIEIEMSPVEDPQTCPNHPTGNSGYHRESDFYTQILPIDDDTFLLAYTDFHYPAQSGTGIRKTILIMTVDIVPTK